MANKWWDGYQHEKNVVLEDIDPDHKCLGHHLKIWGDRYGFIGEAKGGALSPAYDYFVVTSQYHPYDIWPDNATRAAILRRYTVRRLLCYDGKELTYSEDPHDGRDELQARPYEEA